MKTNKIFINLFMILAVSGCNVNNEVSSSLENSELPSESILQESDISSESSLLQESSSTNEEPEIVDKSDYLLNEDYNNLKPLSEVSTSYNDIVYEEDIMGVFDDIKYQELYYNNVKHDTAIGSVLNYDSKYLFYNDETLRFVNCPDGYMFNFDTDTTVNTDFSISHFRSKIYNEESTLTITKETKNPYGSWSTYRNEWIIRHIGNKEFLKANNLSYTEDVIFEDDSILKDYFVSIYSIKINNAGAYKKPYYNIGIVRHEDELKGKKFFLFVMKSTTNKNSEFKKIISSFEEMSSLGKSSNHLLDLPLVNNPNWNESTINYFNKFKSQDRTDWGMYTVSLNDNGEYDNVITGKTRQFEEAFDYTLDILPTYTHVSTNNVATSFPINQAKKHAGGDKTDNKKVLQFTYQFTSNNNDASPGYTPMFDILRGVDDEYDYFDVKDRTHNTLQRLAESIKEYGKPVLFRLNNEMDSDWVSYCGLMTLLDPDIFQATWRYLYKVFEDAGVDNCIWIFNPNSESIPYSNWGEYLCYFPGYKYVQAIGLTYYRDNNNNKVNELTFRKDYTYVYNRNKDSFINYPWIISEFGCGAGGSASGEQFRNQYSQSLYVKGMFNDFADRENHPYLQNIKGAVWFSCNDSGSGGITNLYELNIDKLPDTIAAFKEGLAKSNSK